MNIEHEIDKLIEREGGFVMSPDTAGDAKKYGITQHTLQLWLAREATTDDVMTLNRRTAREIYYSWSYIKPGYHDLPWLIQPVMLDTGTYPLCQSRAIKLLQDAITCHGYPCGKIDGKIGEKTIAAARLAADQMGNKLLRAIINRRVIAYENIVKRDDSQRQHLAGWIARAELFLPK